MHAESSVIDQRTKSSDRHLLDSVLQHSNSSHVTYVSSHSRRACGRGGLCAARILLPAVVSIGGIPLLASVDFTSRGRLPRLLSGSSKERTSLLFVSHLAVPYGVFCMLPLH